MLNETINCGFVDESAIFVDRTYIKTNAKNKTKKFFKKYDCIICLAMRY